MFEDITFSDEVVLDLQDVANKHGIIVEKGSKRDITKAGTNWVSDLRGTPELQCLRKFS